MNENNVNYDKPDVVWNVYIQEPAVVNDVGNPKNNFCYKWQVGIFLMWLLLL